MRRAACAVVSVLFLGACSDPAPPSSQTSEGSNEPAAVATDGTKDHKQKRSARRKHSDKGARSGHKRRAAEQEGSDEAAAESSSAARSTSGAGLALPARGSYSYVQDGWEEFCQAGNCDRRDLPVQEQMRISYKARSARRATFVSSTGSSGSERQEITYSVTRNAAAIIRAENDVSYRGFDYTTRLVPDPPIISARFPLTVGDAWSGQWRDDGNLGDGSYQVRVLREERVSVRGGEERAVVVDVLLRIEGENEGMNELRVWLDPDDLTILSSRGRVEVTSGFGTYRSEFSTSYASGP